MSIDLDVAAAPDHSVGHADGDGQGRPNPPQHPKPAETQYSSEWVAVKIYKPLVQCDLRSLEYLQREVVCQRSLNHAHVIGFREVGITTDMCLYLALEFADNGTLKQWLADRGGRLPEATARWFTQQLVYGLAYCHSHGVCNRDIKPENLLLHSGSPHLSPPILKVADFGLCKSTADSAPKSCVGSLNYMAPEVFSGKKYDGEKADVFSCGIVLYQMVFGALPFSRSLDGRNLNFKCNFRDILDNMRREMWPQLLPQPSATARAAAPAAGAPPAAPGALEPPSAALLDLLQGMLRFDPSQRISLQDVKRHNWYREGLPEASYALVLNPGPGVEQASAQSVELIRAEFRRIAEHCAALQQERERQSVEEELQCVN